MVWRLLSTYLELISMHSADTTVSGHDRGHVLQRALIDNDGLYISDARNLVLDVCLDGQRVWSVVPARDAVTAGRMHFISWPKALRPYLDRTALVTVSEHSTGRVVVEREHRFGDREGRIRVVDASDRPLAMTKSGHLERTFDGVSPAATDSLLDRTSDILAVLRDECGLHHSFLSFGALLGAVREGKLIGHDSDTDVSYLSSYSHPMDVARESLRIERVFHRQGWRHLRFSMAAFKVLITDADGAIRGIDVFGGFQLEEYLYLLPNVRTPLPRSAIVPLGEVEVEGHRLPAPADPPALLEATYGPDWRVPDPSFQFRPPLSTRRRLNGWMRGMKDQYKYWNDFYRSRDSKAVPREPSPFARWVGEHYPALGSLVDIGTGNGRDALWFARSGWQVFGLDYAPAAVNRGRSAAEAESLSASFEAFNLYDLRQVLTMGARLAARDEGTALYGRFLVHALQDEGRHHLWRLARMALRSGGLLFLEFRTGKDAEASHVFGEHFRRLLDPDVVVDEIESYGGHISYREEGHRLAPFREEDPHVCRLVVGWQQ